jgi:phosphoribosyl-ATP pyrophosphohydrolase
VKRIRNSIHQIKLEKRDPTSKGAVSAPPVNGKFVGRRYIAMPQSDAKGGLQSASASSQVLEQLYDALDRLAPTAHPRTFKLLQSGRSKLARKLIEEACEVTVEAVKHHADGVVRESADLLYHLIVLWFRAGIEPIAVWQEMRSRADTLGIAEKLPKTDRTLPPTID